MREIFRLGLTLMCYTLSVGVALAYVSIRTTPLIEQNKAAVENEVRIQVLPGMKGGYEEIIAKNGSRYWIGYTDTEKTAIGGYVAIAYGSGYSSTIQTMVGVAPDGAITGMSILFQQETPGLGAKAEEILPGESDPWFTRQFKDKKLVDNLYVAADGGTIDSITGATITSRAITNSVRSELERLETIMEGRS